MIHSDIRSRSNFKLIIKEETLVYNQSLFSLKFWYFMVCLLFNELYYQGCFF